jgi:hypothetical protein
MKNTLHRALFTATVSTLGPTIFTLPVAAEVITYYFEFEFLEKTYRGRFSYDDSDAFFASEELERTYYRPTEMEFEYDEVVYTEDSGSSVTLIAEDGSEELLTGPIIVTQTWSLGVPSVLLFWGIPNAGAFLTPNSNTIFYGDQGPFYLLDSIWQTAGGEQVRVTYISEEGDVTPLIRPE